MKIKRGTEYDISTKGNVVNLKLEVLHRLRPTGYTCTKYGFELRPIGKIIINNEAMRFRAEREIRKYLRLPPKLADKDTVEEQGDTMTTKMGEFFPSELKVKERAPSVIEAAVSCYENHVAIFVPAFLVGQRFSCIYDDGIFLVSRDTDGLMINEMNSVPARGVVTYSMRKHFPGAEFPRFNQFLQTVDFDGESFEVDINSMLPRRVLGLSHSEAAARTAEPVKMPDRVMPSTPPPIVVAPPANPEQAPAKLTPKERAKKYIDWLNKFAETNEYEIKTEGGKLVLVRSERIG